MMTSKRFREMADSYGADLRRWPEKDRIAAEGLLANSLEARQALEQARTLDDIIASASAHELAWPEGGEDAALMRLRLGVKAQIAAPVASRRKEQSAAAWLPIFQLRWLGFATGGGIAIMAGLLIGLTYTSSISNGPDNLTAMLEPAPINALADLGG